MGKQAYTLPTEESVHEALARAELREERRKKEEGRSQHHQQGTAPATTTTEGMTAAPSVGVGSSGEAGGASGSVATVRDTSPSPTRSSRRVTVVTTKRLHPRTVRSVERALEILRETKTWPAVREHLMRSLHVLAPTAALPTKWVGSINVSLHNGRSVVKVRLWQWIIDFCFWGAVLSLRMHWTGEVWLTRRDTSPSLCFIQHARTHTHT